MDEHQISLITKIDINEKQHKEQGNLMMPSLKDLLENRAKMKDKYSISSYLLLLLSPFAGIVKFFHSILIRSLQKESYTETGHYPNRLERKHMYDHKKIILDLEQILKENEETLSFIDELKVHVNLALQSISLKKLSDNVQIDYSYLNKLLNNKLPDNTVISRDLIVKFGLALQLDFIETNKLLAKSGYILCGQNVRDIILGLCLDHRVGIIDTNILLEQRGLRMLKGT